MAVPENSGDKNKTLGYLGVHYSGFWAARFAGNDPFGAGVNIFPFCFTARIAELQMFRECRLYFKKCKAKLFL
jgi:hypothetical protein